MHSGTKQPLSSIEFFVNCIFLSGLTVVHVEDGDMSIGSTSGELKAFTRRGNIDVNLSQHDDVTLETKEGKLF